MRDCASGNLEIAGSLVSLAPRNDEKNSAGEVKPRPDDAEAPT
jgi:hypothetical protein